MQTAAYIFNLYLIEYQYYKYKVQMFKTQFQKISPLRILILIFFLSLASCVVDRTYYAYLGLDISATQEDIAQAYEAKKLKIEAAEEGESKNNKLKILQQAYDVLRNKQKRNLYDRLNRDLLKKEKVVENLKKITDKNSRRGRSIQITLPVSVEDVYHGKVVEAQFLRQTACEKCRGTGAQSPKFLNPCTRCGGNGFSINQGVNQFGQRFVNQNTCPLCMGWGKQVTKTCPVCQGKRIFSKIEKAKIKIPKGLPDGNHITVNNFGDQPVVGAPSDLQVTIVQIPTERWSREGENLIRTVEISLEEAIFGFEKQIQHLNGQPILISRSQVTTRSTVITIPDGGIENVKSGRKGKLLIKFKIILPKFTDRQLDMWEQFFKDYNL